MANLAGFLKPTYKEKTVQIVISDRFLDEKGEPIPFILKSMTQDRMNAIAKRSVREQTVNGKKVQVADTAQQIARCLIESCIQPDFRDAELCRAYGTEDPVELPQKMLLISEYEKLGQAFLELNGMSSDDFILTGEVTKN